MKHRHHHPSTWNHIRKALDTPRVQWDALCAKRPRYELDQLRVSLDLLAQQSARMAAYLDARNKGGTHAKAVQRQNTVGTTLRRALGYRWPGAASVGF